LNKSLNIPNVVAPVVAVANKSAVVFPARKLSDKIVKKEQKPED
jgi:hypothetical protein